MKRDWKPYHDHLNIFFNKRYIEQKEKLSKLTALINKLRRMIQRIKDSKIKYMNDDALIEDYTVRAKTLIEQKSVIKAKQDRLLKYSMTAFEVNQLTLSMSKAIINQLIRGKEYRLPSYMGTMYVALVKAEQQAIRLDWKLSLENHKKLTKKYAPIIHDKYYIQKSITKKDYFKLSKPLLNGRSWQEYRPATDWLFFRWYPNYKYMRGIGNNYIFKFTAYNEVRDENNKRIDTTGNLLEKLDTKEKILNSYKLGNINKIILIQLQDENYKLNFEKI